MTPCFVFKVFSYIGTTQFSTVSHCSLESFEGMQGEDTTGVQSLNLNILCFEMAL